jgi:hypothetical protein
VRDVRDETGQGRQGADGIFVGSVARVDDPRSIGVVGDLNGPVRGVGRHAKSPRNRPQRNGFERWSRRGGCEVVVVGQREVEVVVGQ